MQSFGEARVTSEWRVVCRWEKPPYRVSNLPAGFR
jgi:hypothetical protein